MKALILAGGNGLRLHPLSLRKPKPMVKLLDRPLLEHQLRFLKESGVEEVCLTLCYLPELIRNAFGDGSALGLRLHYEIETEALGTAGSARRCLDWLGEEPFLLLSGDAAVSFDLGAMRRLHERSRADVTIAVWSVEDPKEYGLVVADRTGRIQHFAEKPSEAEACTSKVNTGVYLLSPSLLRQVPPAEPWDFAKDLFPKLMEEGKRFYAFPLEGYWCDVGNCAAYRRATRDALRGLLPIPAPLPELRPGVRSASPLPEGVEITPPCVIGENVCFRTGCRVGPDCVIGSGAVIGAGAEIQNSVLGRVRVGERAKLLGTVAADGVILGRESLLCEGSVLAEDCVLGDRAVVESDVALWPGKVIPAGCRVGESLGRESLYYRPVFDHEGVLSAQAGSELRSGHFSALGAAAAAFGTVGAAFTGGNDARLGAEAFLSGAAAQGGDVLLLDAQSEASAAFMAHELALNCLLFLRWEKGRFRLRFYGEDGFPVGRSVERKLEQAALQPPAACAEESGSLQQIRGCEEQYAAALLRLLPEKLPQALPVVFTGRSAPTRALERAFARRGARFAAQDAVRWQLSPDGADATAFCPNGQRLTKEKLTAVLCLLEWRAGTPALAVPEDAPLALDDLAKREGGRLLRLEKKNDEAKELWFEKPYYQDVAHLTARLIACLAQAELSLEEAAAALPPFYTAEQELMEGCGRDELLERLGAEADSAVLGRGIRVKSARGSTWIRPTGANAYRVSAESFREEYAVELCAETIRRLGPDKGARNGD